MKNKTMLIIVSIVVLFTASFFAYAESPQKAENYTVMPEARGDGSEIMINLEESNIEATIRQIVITVAERDGEPTDILGIVEYTFDSSGNVEDARLLDLNELDLTQNEEQ